MAQLSMAEIADLISNLQTCCIKQHDAIIALQEEVKKLKEREEETKKQLKILTTAVIY